MFGLLKFRPEGGDAGAAPAPAPAAAPAPVPTTGPALSAVEQATQAARAQLATGNAADGSAPTPAPAAAPIPVPPAGEQVRASDGTFAPPVPPVDGEAPAGDEPAPSLVVEMALAEGALPIEFPDEETANIARERFALAERAETIQREAAQQLDDVLAVRSAVETDPVGFVLSEIGSRPEAVSHLVMSLVVQDTPAAAELRAAIAKLAADPNELRVTRAEQAAARHEYAQETQARIAEERATSQNLREVEAGVAAILPRTLTPEQQQVLYADVLRDLQGYAVRHKLMTIPPQDIPLIVRGRLTAYGVDPVTAAQQIDDAIARLGSRPAARNGRPPAPARAGAPVPRPAPAPARTGAAFVAAQQSRRAAAVPGAGAGSPGTPAVDFTVPLNEDGSKKSIAEATAWHRSQVASGRRLLPTS